MVRIRGRWWYFAKLYINWLSSIIKLTYNVAHAITFGCFKIHGYVVRWLVRGLNADIITDDYDVVIHEKILPKDYHQWIIWKYRYSRDKFDYNAGMTAMENDWIIIDKSVRWTVERKKPFTLDFPITESRNVLREWMHIGMIWIKTLQSMWNRVVFAKQWASGV